MKKKREYLLIGILIILILFLTGCNEKSNNELKDKVVSELGYVNIKILDMLNSLNNITFENYTIISKEVKLDDKTQRSQAKEKSNNNMETQESSKETSGEQNEGENGNKKQESESQDLINTTEMMSNSILASDRNNIDWNIIKPEIELLSESWSIIVIDLYSLNAKNETILDFSSKIDLAMVAIANEDKIASLNALANMYESIPALLDEINADKNLKKIRQTQSYVIKAYVVADNMANIDINNNLEKAIDVYSEVISDIDFTKDKTYKTNKAYVLLNELANSLETRNSEVFYVKYKNFMECINEI